MNNHKNKLLSLYQKTITLYSLVGKLNLYLSFCIDKDCMSPGRIRSGVKEIRNLLNSIELVVEEDIGN